MVRSADIYIPQNATYLTLKEGNKMVDVRSRSAIYSIVVLLGAIVGIAGVFMAWLQIDLFVGTYSVSGWEILNNAIEDSTLDNIVDGYPRWMPLIALVFAVIALLNSLVAIARPGKTGGIIAVISGLLMIVSVILFATYSETVLLWTFKASDYISTGVYMTAVAGILILIFGVLMSSSKTKG